LAPPWITIRVGAAFSRDLRRTLSWLRSWLKPLLLVLPLVIALAALGALIAARARDGLNEGRPSGAAIPVGSDPIKIAVTEDGLYAVRIALGGTEPSALRLTLRGREVPFLLAGEDNAPMLIFYGQANRGIYSAANVYWLRAEGGGARMEERDAPPPGAPALDGLARLRLEEDRLYHALPAPGEDHWLWEALYAPATLTRTLTLPHLAAGEGRLVVALWSGTNAAVNPDHHLRIHLNGHVLADERWDGITTRLITATVPIGVLREGENTLSLEAVGDTGAPVDQVFLNWVQLDYPRHLNAAEGALAFSSAASAYHLSGFSEDAFVLDITDPDRPLRLKGRATGDGLAFGSVANGLRRYLVASVSALRSPASVTPARAPKLKDEAGGADYLVIAPDAFAEALQPLLDWRERQGLRVRRVSPEEIYDAYNYGMKDTQAIRDFLRDAHARWQPAPRFILLVGDASYDYKHILRATQQDIVPTRLVYTTFAGDTASDTWYAEDDQGRPLFAIGRLPAQTPEQVKTMVSKIIAYEQAPAADWQRRALVVADNEDPAFESLNEQLINSLPSGYTAERVYFSQAPSGEAGQLHQAVVEAFNRGLVLVNYIGHGSLDVWGEEQALTVKNVADLKNGDRLPILTAYTCLNGFFHHPQATSLAEALLWQQGGGIVGAVVPSGRSLTSQQAPLAQAFTTALFSPDVSTLGEALQRAQETLLPDGSTPLEVIRTFNLLGDPALRFIK